MRVHSEVERDIANESSVYGLGEQVDSGITLGRTGRIALREESSSYCVWDTEKCLQDILVGTGLRTQWGFVRYLLTEGICRPLNFLAMFDLEIWRK